MDGFRDRLNRGASDRGSYDRYDRSSRRSSYGAAAPSSVSSDEIAQIVDESNGKQLEVINDLFEDAKDDRFESEKQILAAIDDLIAAVNSKEEKEEIQEIPVVEADESEEEANAKTEEILSIVASNADLLAQFAEEQLPMLVRGNSSILNQIREALDEQDEIIRRLSEDVARNSQMADIPSSNSGNEEVLSATAANNALLNAIRSDVAGIQAEIRSTTDRLSAKADEENAPLDDEDVLTKTKAEEMYKNLDETIHSDCVKVYRNVQKLMEEKGVGADDSADLKKSIGGLKVLTIVNLLLLILNLVALLASVFGII